MHVIQRDAGYPKPMLSIFKFVAGVAGFPSTCSITTGSFSTRATNCLTIVAVSILVHRVGFLLVTGAARVGFGASEKDFADIL